MTLCIAWKTGTQIQFASDSRVSTDDTHYADVAIKIMEVPVKIYNPTPSETGIDEVIYDRILGMCYAGDSMNAFLIKETIYDVLQRLQLLPLYSDFSLNGICRVIAKFFENTSDALRDGVGWDPGVEFLNAGYWPKEEHLLVYKFELVDYGDHYEAMYSEVLDLDEDIIILGSGADKAEEIIAANNIPIGRELLKVLKYVCNDVTEPSVGGYLQYGCFENDNFNIYGISDYRIDDDDNLEYIYCYRGTILYKEKFESKETDFHIAGTFIMPFEDEINAYWKRKGIELI